MRRSCRVRQQARQRRMQRVGLRQSRGDGDRGHDHGGAMIAAHGVDGYDKGVAHLAVRAPQLLSPARPIMVNDGMDKRVDANGAAIRALET